MTEESGMNPVGGEFGGGGGFDMGGLLEQAMQMQQQMLETQARLAEAEVEGQAGGGVVRIVMTGEFDVRAVHLAPEVVDPNDIEMLADLVQAAIRDAVARVTALHAAGMGAGMPDVGQLLEGLGGLDLTGVAGTEEFIELEASDPDNPDDAR
jgi:nucleoid-associated protein EbfC